MKAGAFYSTALIFIFLVACSQDREKPGYEIRMLSDMKDSVAYEAGTLNPVFKNGITSQPPVQGTIPRGGLGLQDQDMPAVIDAKSLQRGQYVYENYCLMCHGATGEGDGQLIPKYPNPPSFHSERLLKMMPEDFYRVLVEGKNDMPSHAGQILEADRWKLIQYIEKLQGKTP